VKAIPELEGIQLVGAGSRLLDLVALSALA
jgi:hypothetical protein